MQITHLLTICLTTAATALAFPRPTFPRTQPPTIWGPGPVSVAALPTPTPTPGVEAEMDVVEAEAVAKAAVAGIFGKWMGHGEGVGEEEKEGE